MTGDDGATWRGAAGADWYRDHRRDVERYFGQPAAADQDVEDRPSPSGRYRLAVGDVATRPGAWDYTRGRVYCGDALVAEVRRNYGIFHAGWAEGHPNGHDYLLCGEDYQGQTVIELDTGRRVDWVPAEAEAGHGFCPAAYHPSPDGRLVVIDGCYWACPYELVLCRFDDPMRLPWPQLHRTPLSGEAAGWVGGAFEFDADEDVRLPDGKLYDDLTDAEQAEYWARRADVAGVRRTRWRWGADGSRTRVAQQVLAAGS